MGATKKLFAQEKVSLLYKDECQDEKKMFEIYFSNELYYLSVFRGKYNFQMRYLTLILMAIQCICVVLCMKLSVTCPASDGKQYLTPVAVVLEEMLKLFTSLFMIFQLSGGKSIQQFFNALHGEFTYDIRGNLLVCIPGVLFLFQNNLKYTALERLPVSIYQVTSQLKVLTTAIFSVILLGRRLGKTRWFACFLLFIGVLLVQKSSGGKSMKEVDSFQFTLGFLASITCSITSGLGSVIIEKVVKESDSSEQKISQNFDLENKLGNNNNEEKCIYMSTVWGRNVILSLIGIFGGIPLAWISARDRITKYGVFQGFTKLTILVIFLNAYGGFIVMGVLKYSDSIMKCFFNALTIVLITLISWLFIGDSTPSIKFFIAASIVIIAVNIYTLNKVLPDKFADKLHRIMSINLDFSRKNKFSN